MKPQSATKSTKFESAVLSAVNIEHRRKQSKQSNVIVSGIPYSDQTGDKEFVQKLLCTDFHVDESSIIGCERLGTKVPARIQLTKVRLTNSADASLIVSSAKQLRRSVDSYVKQHVYINNDLTKSEAAAAYESRCRRRLKRDGVGATATEQPGLLNAEAQPFSPTPHLPTTTDGNYPQHPSPTLMTSQTDGRQC